MTDPAVVGAPVGDAPDAAIAIVGVACRLPGGITTLDELWLALAAKRDLVGEVTPDRFDTSRFFDANRHRPGKSYAFAAGLLDDIAGFDAEFFGMSPAEASRIDPQQRLLLELAVEAVDDSGIDPGSLAGSDTCVYVGVCDQSYLTLQSEDPRSINAYTQSGGAPGNTANRLSHWLDIRGPSVAMDTACSSSLVALHHACDLLRSGVSEIGLVGGVSILLNPYFFVGFAKASMLSPSGRCRTFSAAADGYVRAEGGAVIVLKRLAAARADGDRVHGVILASGTNSDGRTVGLSHPSCDAQEALLRDVYDRARVEPDDLAYLEAHGTGTVVGDPVECEAIGRALGSRRSPGRSLPIGSIKSNVGHLEAASGLAGVLKGLLVLRHGVIPASLHALPLNPSIDFAGWQLEPVTDTRPLPGPSEVTVVGINSFGMGGANAHVILARPAPEPNGPPPDTRPAPRQLPILVSAHSPPALVEVAHRLAETLAGVAADDFYDLCYTACRRRGHHAYRAVVLAEDVRAATRQFEDLSQGLASGAGVTGVTPVPAGGRRLVFVFSGNGSQWAGMGADLLEAEPTFRVAVEEVDRLLVPRLGWSVLDELRAPPEESRLDRTDVAQPALFALQVGLVALLREHGIAPDAVVGHSVGEVAAAYAAGALDLASAALVVAERSRAQSRTAHQGSMAAVGLSADEAAKAIAPYAERLELAAVNSDQDVTVSGERAALEALGEDLRPQDVFFRMLDIDYPFHSRAMDPLEAPLLTGLSAVTCSEARLPMASTATGHLLGRHDRLDGRYWWRNVREPVLFGPAVRALANEGYGLFLEVGPHPILGRYLKRVTAHEAPPAAVLATLSKECDGPDSLRRSVAMLMAVGAEIDWDVYFPHAGRVTALPTYPWQRERHWNGSPQAWGRMGGDGAILDHPLLGGRLSTAEATWSGTIERTRVPWLADHVIGGTVVMPAAAFLELAMAAGRRLFNAPVEVIGLEVRRPLVVPSDDDAPDIELQVSLSDEDGVLRIASRSGAGEWIVNARGRVQRLLAREPDPVDPRLPTVSLGTLAATDMYSEFAARDMTFGPRLRLLRQLSVGPGEVLATYEQEEADARFEIHPAILDAALQSGFPLFIPQGGDKPFLLVLIERTRVWQPPARSGLVHARVRSVTNESACWDVTVTDKQGRVAVEVLGCWARRAAARTRPHQHLQTVLRAAPHDLAPIGPVALPSPDHVVAAVSGELVDILSSWGPHEGVRAGLQDLQGAFVGQAVERLLPGAGVFNAVDLIAAGVMPKFARLLDLLLGLAAGAGCLQRVGDGYCLADVRSPEGIFRRLAADHPDTINALTLFGRCGAHLVEILQGQRDPTQMLYAESERSVVEQTYESLESHLYNRVIARLLREVIGAWPPDRPLRVLEVGAGTGATTAVLLPLLSPERTLYTFSDVSRGFFPRAQRRFAAFDFVEYRCFDLESDPSEQGIAEAGYDIVIAANVLHATSDLKATVRRIAFALDDGGCLLAVESHDPELYALCFGLLDGYWLHTDSDLRPASCLLPREGWPPLLSSCEFDDVAQVPGATERSSASASVILARRARRARRAQRAHRALGGPPSPPAAAGEAVDAWIVVADPEAQGLVRHLSAELAATGPVHLIASDAGTSEWTALLSTQDTPPTIVVITGTADAAGEPPPEGRDEAILGAVHRCAAQLRCIAMACDELPGGISASLWLVTRPSGALPAPERPGPLADAGSWGVSRSLANEEPRLTVRRVSLERTADAATDARRLAHELRTPSDEDEVVLTAGGRFVPRLVQIAPVLHAHDGPPVPYVLELRDAGPAYRLAWTEARPAAPAPDEVVVEVRAAGINYRDVMIAAGTMPVDAVVATDGRGGLVLGGECAGVVTGVGSQVTTVVPGDRVFALAPSSMASHVVVNASLVGRIPDGMSFTGAATLPTVFLTVQYGLEHLARLAPGEVVLVHSASGGVGLAALQYARRQGASVIATAGTSSKRDLLRLLGVEHVLDSRSLDFADQVREITGGHGVDVVLNSLAGEAVGRSLDLLRPYGRFVELGKRDIHAQGRLSMGHFRHSRAFFTMDLPTRWDSPVDAVPARVFADVTERIWSGEYRPVPYTVFPASRVDDAFRLVQHSRHLGKVVVSLEEPPAVVRTPAPVVLDPAATYLVTGGLGGLGGATAAWLGERGAGHLALVSRRGGGGPEADQVLEALRSRGITATAYRADAADVDAMGAVLDAIAATGHPLRGVVHAAMQLDDSSLREVDDEQFSAVLRPKLLGGLVLDGLSRDLDLDLFVVFSSATGVVGNINQSSYVAGNLALEALVRARRSAGKAGLAVAWGAVGDLGYVARNDLADSILRLGMGSLSVPEVLSTVEEMLDNGTDVVASGRFDWERLAKVLPIVSTPRFRALIDRHDPDGRSEPGDLLRRLRAATGEEARALVTGELVGLAAEVLELSADRLDPARDLKDLGMDSLTATALEAAIRRRFACDVAALEITGTPSLAELANRVLVRLGVNAGGRVGQRTA